MNVINREFDVANKYRVLVQISNERAIPLKYKTEVDDSVAFAEVQKILDREAIQQAEQAELAQLLEEEQKLLEELGDENY